MSQSQDIVLPGVMERALEAAVGKVLPLVDYRNGERKVIGSAVIDEKGLIDAHVEVTLAEAQDLGLVIGNFSIASQKEDWRLF